jgi:peptidoglycan/LPS O-acetylase OafA/YrhL
VCGVVLVAGARLPPLLTLAMPICGTYLLFYVAYNPHIKLHGFGKKADLSYGIYLYSWPVQQILVQHFERWLTPGLLFVATMPLAMAAALASWVCVEKPFLRLKRPRVPTMARGLPEGL